MENLSGRASQVPVEPLRRLARGLLYDRARAEDVVQEAWLAALSGRHEVRSLGDWLAGTVRRLAGNVRREEARRARREKGAARPEALPGVDETSARIEILRCLLDAVDRLEEPYRRAIVLRFFDELPPREIARRLGLPVNTVRTHVRRGLARLRVALDGEGGRGREELLAALVPFVGKSPGTVLGPAGVWIMQQKVVLTAVLVALVGMTWSVWCGLEVRLDRTDLARVQQVESVERAEGPEVPMDPLLVLSEAQQRRAPSEDSPPPPLGTWIVRGHASRGPEQPFPGMGLLGRLWDGPRASGTAWVVQRFETDENGDFAWALSEPERIVTLSIEPQTNGHRHSWTRNFVPGDPAPQEWTVNVCPVDASLLGIVRDADGAPVAGARVETLEDETTTDGAGRYRLPASSFHGEIGLRAGAAGFAQARTRVRTAEPGENEVADLVLDPERRVTGRVEDEDGAPVEDALVTSLQTLESETRTDAEGRFALGGFDPKESWASVEVQKPGYADGAAQGSGEAELVVQLARGVPVRGRVLAPERTPLAYVAVVIGETPSSDTELVAWTDATGAFEIAGVPPGESKVWASREGFAERSEPLRVGRTPGEPLELVLEREHTLGGLVLDGAGRPLPRASVFAEDGRNRGRMFVQAARTGDDGRFRLARLPGIEVRLSVSHRAHADREELVTELDRDDLVLRLVPRAGFAGRVVDALTGAAVPSFVVQVRFPDESELAEAVDSLPPTWIEGVAFEVPDGRWSLVEDHAPGAMAAIEVSAPGFAPALVGAVPARVEADPNALVIPLARGTLVQGRLVERETGAPIAGARVRRFTGSVAPASPANRGETVFEATTDAAGAFELVDVPTGTMSLSIRHADWPPSTDGPFRVEGERALERWIELARSGVLHGELRDVEGRPLAGETVALYGLEVPGTERSWDSVTAADGSWELGGLPAGAFHLCWARRLGDATAQDLLEFLELGPGEVREVVLRPRGRATVRGRIEFAGEVPPTIAVRLFPKDNDSGHAQAPGQRWAARARATIAADGLFEFAGVEAGTHAAVTSFPAASGTTGLSMGGSTGFFEVPETGTVEVVLEVRAR